MVRAFARRAKVALTVATVVMVGVLTAAGYAVALARGNARALEAGSLRDVILSEHLSAAFERRASAGRGYVLAGDQRSLDTFHAASAEVDATIAELKKRARPPAARDELAAVETALAEHHAWLRRALEQRSAVPLPDAAAFWKANVLPRAEATRATLDAWTANARSKERADRNAAATSDRHVSVLVALAVLGVITLAGVVGPLLYRAAKRQLVDAHDASAFLGRLLDELPIGIIAARAPGGAIIHASATATRLLSRPVRADRVDAYDAIGVAHHLDGSPYPAQDLPLARALRGEVVLQEELVTSEGLTVSTSAAPIRDDGGEIVAAVVAFVDITDRKRGERERELFLGALGHDLRNPLQAISLSGHTLARRDALDESARKIASRIATTADRMTRLIQQLLDFTRSQHGVIPIAPAPCDLYEIARDVIAAVEIGCPGCEVRLEHEGDGRGNWDRDRIAQVFQNLIGNAIEHGAKGEPIHVRIRACGDLACAEIENRGPTIPAHTLGSLFEPFRQSGGSKGLGLGLYIARAIVVAHGGTIEATSNEGVTMFRVLLPHGTEPEPGGHGFASTRRGCLGVDDRPTTSSSPSPSPRTRARRRAAGGGW